MIINIINFSSNVAVHILRTLRYKAEGVFAMELLQELLASLLGEVPCS